MASVITSLVGSGCGDVDLTLLRGGNTSNGGTANTGDGDSGGDYGPDDGNDGTLHLLRAGDDGGDDRNGDMYLSPGGAAISLMIVVSMADGRSAPPLKDPPYQPRMAWTQCLIQARSQVRRLSSMEDNLFTYELGVVEDSYFPCVEQPHDNLKNGDLNVYEPRVLTDDELFDLEEEKVSEEKEIDEIFRIETNIFDFETPLCNEFNGSRTVCYHELMEDDDDIMDLDNNLIQQDVSYYVDEEEERFKERKSKLLGMPYEKPPTFKSEKFEVVYSLGPAEEYVSIKEYEYDIWLRSEENVSRFYEEIFHKKDEG
ncbi:hypothetical protein Tco_1476323 [Tanacetum coccineum]